MTSVPYLSFNAGIATLPVFAPKKTTGSEENDADTVDVSRDVPLEHEWSIWEQWEAPKGSSWEEAMRVVGSAGTVQTFWKYWNNIPQPSQLFSDGHVSKKLVRDNLTIESISVFKKGIKPQWEDPANKTGGEFFWRRGFDPGQLDEYWNNLVLGMMGETIDLGDYITGARVVDKCGKGRPMYRLELWVREMSKEQLAKLEENLRACVGTRLDGTRSKVPAFDYKGHSSAK